MATSTESAGKAPAFGSGDVVRVRGEAVLSVVVLPTDRRPDYMPDDVPDLDGLCCVPVALVRTPVDGGDLRWVEVHDLCRPEPDGTAPQTAEGVSSAS